MKVFARVLHRLKNLRPWLLGAASLGLGATSATADLLDPTPLILKDGRIASVSVHTLPFERGASSLDQGAARDLQGLTVAMATDCFLTAQVIGHVGAHEVEANDTLGAHRLARSRADAVQASLIDGGLPAKSIASVWDWQFMVLEARATLWVFRLTEGEDCEGKALDGVSGALLAAANSEDEAPRETTTRPAAASVEASTGRNGSSIRPGAAGTATDAMARATSPASAAPLTDVAAAAHPAPTARAVPARSSVETAPAPASPSATGTAPAPSSSAARTAEAPSPPAIRRTPAPSSSTDAAELDRSSRSAGRSLPTITPAPKAAPVRQVATRSEPAPAAGDPGSFAIVFATNSSYFPAGTRDRLAAMIRDLEQGRRYRVHLTASVSGTSSVVGASSPDEAARYNKWLADRRLDRVRDWFAANAKDKDLIIEPEYRPGDDSREVVIAIAPAETS